MTIFAQVYIDEDYEIAERVAILLDTLTIFI
jgi:hypothetical protein